ncbi:hypothetical protein V5O48_014572 [Marasmius crinis-equi]|uniref:Ubiquitin-like domain-containing protein n=1 Tax=Marasmius crinis-equi TaxID=585013 RepID=A0ABR3EWX6_9AGAR
MPKITEEHRTSTRSDHKLVLFCDEHERKRVIARRPPSYTDARKCALRHFPTISSDHLVLQTDELDISRGERADITPETWDIIVETISRFFVVERGTQITITFSFKKDCESDPLPIECTISPTITLRELFDGFEKHLRALDPPIYNGTDQITYHYNGRVISASSNASKAPEDLKMADGALIECNITTTPPKAHPLFASAPAPSPFGVSPFAPAPPVSSISAQTTPSNPSTSTTKFGKPVIYIFAREGLNVSVAVSLIPKWSFSALYPFARIEKPGDKKLHQRVEWNVETRHDGSLRVKESGLEVAYLFWEADVNRAALSPPSTPTVEQHPPVQASLVKTGEDCFDPSSCDVTPSNSVLLHLDSLPAYLETALAALGLHTEARTSFITYWLPSFLKHTHIAFRFVSQASYELAAPMDVSPPPDMVTRVFMLFKGVKIDEAWDNAVRRAREDVALWRDVVGVSEASSQTETPRLRILEWGGMEITN